MDEISKGPWEESGDSWSVDFIRVMLSLIMLCTSFFLNPQGFSPD
jgi:hypothetical protein